MSTAYSVACPTGYGILGLDLCLGLVRISSEVYPHMSLPQFAARGVSAIYCKNPSDSTILKVTTPGFAVPADVEIVNISATDYIVSAGSFDVAVGNRPTLAHLSGTEIAPYKLFWVGSNNGTTIPFPRGILQSTLPYQPTFANGIAGLYGSLLQFTVSNGLMMNLSVMPLPKPQPKPQLKPKSTGWRMWAVVILILIIITALVCCDDGNKSTSFIGTTHYASTAGTVAPVS